MKLSAKPINTFNGVNSFSYAGQWSMRAGEPNSLYFQIIDLDQASLRYMLGVGSSNQPASVTVTFPSIDDSLVITKNATAVSAADGSLWKVDLSPADKPSSGNVVFAVTEGSVTKRFNAMAILSVEYPTNVGDC